MASTADTSPVSTRLPPALLAKLDALVAELGGSRSDALRQLLEAYEPAALDPDAPLFDPPLPADEDRPTVRFEETRYDRVGRST